MTTKPDKRRGPLQVDAEKGKAYGLKPLAEPKPKDLLISPNEAARILNVTDQCVRQWIYHGQLNATKHRNGYWRIRVGDIEEYIKARGQMDRKRVVILCPEAQARKAVIAAVEAGATSPSTSPTRPTPC
jgi:excisionase family DNA binding protein